MKGIKPNVYPRERVIHAFKMPSIIQEHREERNTRDELLFGDHGNFSNLESVNSRRSDYNMYKLTICVLVNIVTIS